MAKQPDFSKLAENSTYFNDELEKKDAALNKTEEKKEGTEVSDVENVEKPNDDVERKREKSNFDLLFTQRDNVVKEDKNSVLINVSDVTKQIIDHISSVLDKNKKDVCDAIVIDFFIKHKEELKKIEVKKTKKNIIDI